MNLQGQAAPISLLGKGCFWDRNVCSSMDTDSILPYAFPIACSQICASVCFEFLIPETILSFYK